MQVSLKKCICTADRLPTEVILHGLISVSKGSLKQMMKEQSMLKFMIIKMLMHFFLKQVMKLRRLETFISGNNPCWSSHKLTFLALFANKIYLHYGVCG